MNLNEEIRNARNRKKWSQGKLGKLMGVTQQAVSDWERGGSISEEHWPKLKMYLGIDVESSTVGIPSKDEGNKSGSNSPSAFPPSDGFQTVMGELFAQITDWVSEVEGRDTRAAMDFAEELYRRFQELRDWKKKQRQSGIAGTVQGHQDRKAANGEG